MIGREPEDLITTRTGPGAGTTAAAARAAVLPLALAQFICSYAASNMNVAISTIATHLDTTVTGIQTTITLFTLTMAALMIPGSKLTDIWGRKVCFIAGLAGTGSGPCWRHWRRDSPTRWTVSVTVH